MPSPSKSRTSKNSFQFLAISFQLFLAAARDGGFISASRQSKHNFKG